MRNGLLCAGLALLYGCSHAQPPTTPPARHDVDFVCDQGEKLSVRFFPQQGVAVLVRHGDTIELQQQPSGSGFMYSNGLNTIRGKGSALRVEIGRMRAIECEAKK